MPAISLEWILFFGLPLLVVGRTILRKRRADRSAPAPADQNTQALIVKTISIPVTPEQVFGLQDALGAALDDSGAGVMDGHEMAVDGREAIFYIYGPDAEALFDVTLPILTTNPITAGALATLRFGEAGAKSARQETRVIPTRAELT